MTETPPGLLRERARRQGSLLVFCSLIFPKTLKAHVDMVVRWQPLGFMSALCGEPLVQPEALRLGFFVFLEQNWRRVGVSCLRAPTVLRWLLWSTCLVPGRCKTSPIGGVVILPAGEEHNTFGKASKTLPET